jgi:hypothetical protein
MINMMMRQKHRRNIFIADLSRGKALKNATATVNEQRSIIIICCK